MTTRLPITAALRSLRREPGLAAGVIATLALAIGVTATMLELVTRLMLSAPPGITDPERVVRMVMQADFGGGQKFAMTTTSFPFYESVAGLTEAFSLVAAAVPGTTIWGSGEDAREIRSIGTTGNYFRLLGATPSRGRLLGSADDEAPAGNTVAVISHAFWKSRFDGSDAVLGQSILLGGTPFTIVGVAAQDFTGDNVAPVDVFLPLHAAMRDRGSDWMTNPNMNAVSIVARLRDGVTAVQAAGLATTNARAALAKRGITAIELESPMPTSVRNSPQSRVALWLAGVSLLVLLIATANVGTLLVLRSARKRRDAAVRLALGASRTHLGIQAVTESVLLAVGGAITGLVLARWLGDLARVTLLPNLAPTERLFDARVMGVAVLLAVIAGAAAALGPIMLVSRYSLTSELYGGGTLGSTRESRTQRGLVALQVALCSVLLVGAGLFVRSLQRVQGQDLGYSTRNLVYAELDFRQRPRAAERDAIYMDAVERLRRMPGIVGATVTQAMPFASFHIPPISVPGLNEAPNVNGQLPAMYAATPEYLDLMNVKPVQGRLFTAADLVRGAPFVVLVNETFAREVWPNQSPLGRCVRAGHDPVEEPGPGGMASSALPCRTVVGVVHDSRVRSLVPTGREASLMQYYVPFGQDPIPPFAPDYALVHGLLMKTAQDPDQAVAGIQRLLQSATAAQVYARVRPYQDLLDPQMRPWRLGATVFVAFGALAICITAVGLFGVISYLVSQRTREIGLRLALGGTGAGIGTMVVSSALRIVAVGVVAGLAIALAAGRYLRDLLFQTSPTELSVFAFAALTFVAVTVVAAAWPAIRAARVSPMTALRVE